MKSSPGRPILFGPAKKNLLSAFASLPSSSAQKTSQVQDDNDDYLPTSLSNLPLKKPRLSKRLETPTLQVSDTGTSDTEQGVAPGSRSQLGKPLPRPHRAVRPSQKALKAAEMET